MKQYFSFSLFKDAMKQLRVHGFVFLIIVCFPVFFGGMFLDINDANIPVSYFAVLSYPIIAPIMTFYLFGFLNKRNSSDFYHGIPKSRTCVYVTYVSAIMAWIAAILFSSTALAFTLCQIQKHTTKIQEIDIYHNIESVIKYEIAYKETALLLCSLLICSLLVVAVITIGMSLSGTVFTGMAIAGMILFFPSVLLIFVNGHIDNIAPYVSPEHFFFLVNSELDNMVASSVASIFGVGGYWNFEDILLNGSKTLYTLILSVIYLFFGGILFNKRKSECAGFSSIYPIVQTTIRCLCCITFSLIPLSLLFEKMTNTYYYTNYTDIIMLYLIAIIIYFMFELISTKRVKNLVKAIPGLLIVAASNIVLCLIIFSACSISSKFQPDAEDIDYVVIDFNLNKLDYSYGNEYLNQIASEYKIDDYDIRNLVAKRLKVTIQSYNSDDSEFDYSYNYNSLCFGICVDGKMTYRNLKLTNSNKIKLMGLIRNNTDILQKYFDIQKPTKNDLTMRSIKSSVISADALMDIYDSLMEEIETLPNAAKESIKLGVFYEPDITNLPQAQQDMQRFYLVQTIKYKEKYFKCDFCITPLTPKTYNMVLKHLTEHFTTYVQNHHLLSDENCYELDIYSTARNTNRYISNSELYFEEFFEAAKSASGIPTVEDNFYLIKDYSNSNYIGVLMASEELDRFMINGEFKNETDYNEYYYD